MTDNNSKLFDLMDAINQTAKSKGYTNGISWAREALEQKKIDQLTFNGFEKCHSLRNMMGHGCASEIQISDKTLEIANAFYQAIAPEQPDIPGQTTSPKAEEKPAPKYYYPRRSPIRLGDYVIMMRNEKRYWGTFSTTPEETAEEQKEFTPGFVFRVENKDMKLYSLTAPNGDYTDPIWMMEHSDRAYIFRTEQDLDVPGKSLYVIDRPKITRESGKHFLTIQYIQYDGQEKDPEVQELTCEGYLADPYTFTTPFPLIADSDDETATLKEGEELRILPRENKVLQSHIRLGDYVIMMLDEKRYWDSFTNRSYKTASEQRIFQPGLIFHVKDKKLNGFLLPEVMGDNEEKDLRWWAKRSTDIYIFRTTQLFSCCDDVSLYVIDTPKIFEKDGKPFITFQYTYVQEGREDHAEIEELTCEGYKAQLHTFEETFPHVWDSDGNKLPR